VQCKSRTINIRQIQGFLFNLSPLHDVIPFLNKFY